MQPEFFDVTETCERRFAVSRWQVDGVPMWPLVKIAGRGELIQQAGSASANPQGASPGKLARLRQTVDLVASPFTASLARHSDWKHEIWRLRPCDALFLSDSVSLDNIGGMWRDRYCAPLMEALAAAGRTSLLMQPYKQRLPRQQDTYSATWIANWGRIMSRARRPRSVELPDFEPARDFLRGHGMDFRALADGVIERWGTRIACMASLFDGVLARTRPTLAFAVAYYWDFGYALNLACRRRGILSLDIQHGSQDGLQEGYNRWSAVPDTGYGVMPAVFWNWSQSDAQAINDWAGRMPQPWHRGLWGGHPQLASWLDDNAPLTRAMDAEIAAIKVRHPGERDILVALQDLPAYGDVWDRLADLILASPPDWRWWIRRHPTPEYNKGVGIRKLIGLRTPNVLVEPASTLPLPALLRNVDMMLSLMSGAAVEASYFGHRPIFLTEDARTLFAAIFQNAQAEVVTDMHALGCILEAPEAYRRRPSAYRPPPIARTLDGLWDMAATYRQLANENSCLPH